MADAIEGEIPASAEITPSAEADESGSELSWSEDPTQKRARPKPLGKPCQVKCQDCYAQFPGYHLASYQ